MTGAGGARGPTGPALCWLLTGVLVSFSGLAAAQERGRPPQGREQRLASLRANLGVVLRKILRRVAPGALHRWDARRRTKGRVLAQKEDEALSRHLDALEQRLARLTRVFGPTRPEVRRLAARLAELRREAGGSQGRAKKPLGQPMGHAPAKIPPKLKERTLRDLLREVMGEIPARVPKKAPAPTPRQP